MITLTLDRIYLMDQRTIGRLTTPMRYFWTVEDAVREKNGVPVEQWKIKGQTAIPKGTYPLIVTFSNRFQKMLPLLVDVPGFSGVRIHAGNTEHDTEGCILLGLGLAADSTSITNSRAAMVDFMDEMDGYLDAGLEIELRIA